MSTTFGNYARIFIIIFEICIVMFICVRQFFGIIKKLVVRPLVFFLKSHAATMLRTLNY